MWLHAAVPARTSDWVVPDSGFGKCAAFSSLWGSLRRRQAYVWEASNCCVQRTLCLKPSIRDSGSCYVKFGAHGLREVQQVAGVVLCEVLSHCRGSCHCSCRRSVVWPDCSACCTCYQPGYRVTLHASLCHPRDRSSQTVQLYAARRRQCCTATCSSGSAAGGHYSICHAGLSIFTAQ